MWKFIIDGIIHVRPVRLDKRWHVSFERKVDFEVLKFEQKIMKLQLFKRGVLSIESIKNHSMYLRHFYKLNRLTNHLYHCIHTAKRLCVNCERALLFPQITPFGLVFRTIDGDKTRISLKGLMWYLIYMGPNSRDFNPVLPHIEKLRNWLKTRRKSAYNPGLKVMMEQQTRFILDHAYTVMKDAIAEHFFRIWKDSPNYGFRDKRFHSQPYLRSLEEVFD